MKPDFRKTMIWLHTYSGLVLGWLLLAIFVTGTLSYFNHEISQWMKPELGSQPASSNVINKSLQRLNSDGPDAIAWRINLATPRNNHLKLSWSMAGEERRTRHSLSLDSHSLKEIDVRATDGGNFFRSFHYTLQLRNYGGRYFAGIAAMMMLVGIFSGIFTHRRFFRDFFTVRLNNVLKTLTDLHAVVGVITIPFCFVLSLSALFIYINMYMPWSMDHHYDKGSRELNVLVSTSLPKLVPANIAAKPLTNFDSILSQVQQQWPEPNAIARISYQYPFDVNGRIVVSRHKSLSLSNKTQVLAFSSVDGHALAGVEPERLARQLRRIFYGLHEALFAAPGLRWLLFFMGSASCLLIGSGLIMWLNKRLAKVKKRHVGHYLVERLNIAGIIGLALAIASYFYANRLLALNLEERADAEISVFLLTWLAALIYSFVRPAQRAWRELLLITTVAYLLLPVVDFIIHPQWLLQALHHSNWVYLGVDIALLTTGAITLIFYCWLRGRKS